MGQAIKATNAGALGSPPIAFRCKPNMIANSAATQRRLMGAMYIHRHVGIPTSARDEILFADP